ncbi:hypothetical protein [Novosphingobium sp.]
MGVYLLGAIDAQQAEHVNTVIYNHLIANAAFSRLLADVNVV